MVDDLCYNYSSAAVSDLKEALLFVVVFLGLAERIEAVALLVLSHFRGQGAF